jgi:hypothetical protein
VAVLAKDAFESGESIDYFDEAAVVAELEIGCQAYCKAGVLVNA